MARLPTRHRHWWRVCPRATVMNSKRGKGATDLPLLPLAGGDLQRHLQSTKNTHNQTQSRPARLFFSRFEISSSDLLSSIFRSAFSRFIFLLLLLGLPPLLLLSPARVSRDLQNKRHITQQHINQFHFSYLGSVRLRFVLLWFRCRWVAHGWGADGEGEEEE